MVKINWGMIFKVLNNFFFKMVKIKNAGNKIIQAKVRKTLTWKYLVLS